MRGSGWTVVSAVVLVGVLLLAGSYLVIQSHVPQASATAPVTPEVRQFGVFLHTFEGPEETVRHWMPGTIVVNAGDSVILRVTNTDEEDAHGFSLAASNISIPSIAPGETVAVRFRASRPGVYRYGCTLVGCAADHENQRGQFVVLSGR